MLRGRLIYAGLWLLAASLLGWRSLPFLGLGPEVEPDCLNLEHRLWALGAACLIGVLKGRTVLKVAARRNVDGLLESETGLDLKRLFPARLIGLILAMMALGYLIRLSPYDPAIKAWIVSLVYPGVGLGLILGATEIMTWRRRQSARS